MPDIIELWDRPPAGRSMIIGWRQWADAGSVSSGLPRYLVELTQARQVGRIAPRGFYLFQMPAGHHLLRPVVKLEGGLVQSMEGQRNDLYYAGDEDRGFFIFLGDEPHLNAEDYAEAILDLVERLGIVRVAALGGVYGAVPFDADRDIGCAYSLARMKRDLDRLAVRYSDYEGGTTIGTFLVDRAAKRGIDLMSLYALVPSYDLGKPALLAHSVAIAEDFKAWYDLMTRINYLFDLGLDLLDLQEQSKTLVSAWEEKITELARIMPQLEIPQYMTRIRAEFVEQSFVPFSDIWEQELKDLFGDDKA